MIGTLERALTGWAQTLQGGAPHDFGTEEVPLVLPSFELEGVPVALLEGKAAGFSPEYPVPVVIFSVGDCENTVAALYLAPLTISVIVPVNITGITGAFHSALVAIVRAFWNDVNLAALSASLASESLAVDGFWLQVIRDAAPVDAFETTITYRLGVGAL